MQINTLVTQKDFSKIKQIHVKQEKYFMMYLQHLPIVGASRDIEYILSSSLLSIIWKSLELYL